MAKALINTPAGPAPARSPRILGCPAVAGAAMVTVVVLVEQHMVLFGGEIWTVVMGVMGLEM